MQSLFERQSRASASGWRLAEYFLLAVGFVCLGIYGYTWAEGQLFQSYEEYQLESTIKGRPGSVWGYTRWLLSGGGPGAQTSGADDDAYQTLAKPAPPGPKPVPADGLIGRIEIPRLDVTAIIREGVDSKTLRRSAGHVPGTALPGEDGNVAVAAHRDTYFRGLRDIQENDRIKLVTRDGTYEYIVRGTQIVKPENVEVLEPQRKREMTLITCYPFNYVGHAPNRFIVKAEQVESQAVDAKAESVPVMAPANSAPKVKKAVTKPKAKAKAKARKVSLRRSAHLKRL